MGAKRILKILASFSPQGPVGPQPRSAHAARVIARVALAHGEEGQSLLEFLLMLPVMLGLSVILLRVNIAIQESIVNQQYARAQAFSLAMNSAVYPRLSQRIPNFDAPSKLYNKMVLGVADNAIDAKGEPPIAPTQEVTRNGKSGGGDDSPHAEPTSRAVVRIRTTVTLCTQTNVVGSTPIIPLTMQGTTDPEHPLVAVTPTGGNTMGDKTVFQFCTGPT